MTAPTRLDAVRRLLAEHEAALLDSTFVEEAGQPVLVTRPKLDVALQALAADAERMDYLEHFMSAGGDRSEAVWRALRRGMDVCKLVGFDPEPYGEGATVRAAIDHARGHAAARTAEGTAP